MGILKELVTDRTDVITLVSSDDKDEKLRVIGLDEKHKDSSERYIKNMYIYNDKWYYFKKDSKDSYESDIENELLSMHFFKILKAKTVLYKIAKNTHKSIGIASRDFRTKGSTFSFFPYKEFYDYLSYLLESGKIKELDPKIPLPIQYLQNMNKSDEDKKKLTQDILKKLAVDLYMQNSDSVGINVQLRTRNGVTLLAPNYDYSCCLDYMKDLRGNSLQNIFVSLSYVRILDFLNNEDFRPYQEYLRPRRLNYETIKILIDEYPEFLKYIEILASEGFINSWIKLCEEYNFNQDTITNQKIIEDLKKKEENRKERLELILK